MGLIYYDIAAVFIVSMNLFLFYSKRHLFITQSRIFGVVLLLSLGSATMDVLSVVTYWNVQGYPLSLLYAINMAYYAFHNSLPFAYCLFIVAIIGRLPEFGQKRIALLGIPWLIDLIIITTTGATGWAFRFSADRRYERGPALFAIYAIALFYIIVGLSGLVRYRRQLARDVRATIFMFAPVSLLPVAIQYFYPQLLIQNLGVAISELIVLLTLQDFGKYIDRTSGFFNRDGFVAQLEELERKRRKATIYIVTLDAVDFLRHALGMEAFASLDREVSRRLFGFPRADRFAAQLGVGYFALTLVDQSPDREAAERAELLRRFDKPWTIRGHLMAVSARVCEIKIPEDTRDIQRVFQAQRLIGLPRWPHPRGTIVSLADLSLSDTGRQLEVARAIRRALSTSGFELHIQPIFHAADNRIICAEALLRLRDERLGSVPPGEFIPIAERNDSIHRIGDLVMEEACAFMARLRSEKLPLDYLEINLSAAQCLQSDLLVRLMGALARHGIKAADLRFEITETAAYYSPATLKRNLESLEAFGFSIAIDDFGTGHSNIANLMAIPFRAVKLDRGLILGMEASDRGRTALEGSIAMFRRLDAEIIAEGVETADQYAALRSMGVELFQGYHFARPMPMDDFLCLLRTGAQSCI